MIDNGYVFANDNKRVFINTSLGCAGECVYCYLNEFGYSNNSSSRNVLSMKEILKLIDKSSVHITKETLITIGCYSECFDEINKNETIKLVIYFLKKGNQVQLSTKQQIEKEDILLINKHIKYYGQLVIFISMPAILMQPLFEKKTAPINARTKNFTLLNEKNIPAVLYIKPVLKGVTIKDLNQYIDFIKKYNIKNIVVGSIFTSEVSDETVHFSSENKLFYNKISEEDDIIFKLSKITSVYRRSSEVMHMFYIKHKLNK